MTDSLPHAVSPAYRHDAEMAPFSAAECGAAIMNGTTVIPVIIEPGAGSGLLSEFQAVDFATDPAEAWERLVRAFRKIQADMGPRWPDGWNPYPGLSAFEARYATVFHGRGDDTNELVKEVRRLEAAWVRRDPLVQHPPQPVPVPQPARQDTHTLPVPRTSYMQVTQQAP